MYRVNEDRKRNAEEVVEVGASYLSDNPCFPRQIFRVVSVESQLRFSRDNYLVHYERWAHQEGSWKLVEVTASWLWKYYDLGDGKKVKATDFGLKVPEDLAAELSA
ncbi:MAG: hypothetical protein LC687_00195 [Actinobacteria bacterium]|nr:hypothetical protein [Actinomycetota bacterium]MCA1806290.1 hypothetical protein [Actinomycetota bacterium]